MSPSDGAEGHEDVVEAVLAENTVLFVTGFPGVESKLDAWLGDVPTRFATTVSDAYAAFDASTAVVCVSDNLLDDELEAFRTDVLVRHPFCQFVLVESRTVLDGRADAYDVVLQGPVSREQLHDTVKQRLTYATYSTLLQEYYLTNTRALAYSRLHDAEEAIPDHLAERIEQLLPQLQALQADLSEAQLREISNIVERHKEFVTRPTTQPSDSAASKYHPGACPECGVAWGDDHGNELGRGCEDLGAGVWKCRHCGEIVHNLHDSNRSIKKS